MVNNRMPVTATIVWFLHSDMRSLYSDFPYKQESIKTSQREKTGASCDAHRGSRSIGIARIFHPEVTHPQCAFGSVPRSQSYAVTDKEVQIPGTCQA